MYFKTIFCFLIVCSLNTTFIFSQGCSDAGFCSISGINPSSQLDSTQTLNNQILFGFTSGLAQFGVLINSPSIQYDTKLTKDISLSAKLNYSFINGSLTSNHGLSDIYLTSRINLNKKVSLINGVKMPFNNANKSYKGSGLPMAYQTTLGTYDYLLGINYSNTKILINAGTQIPIIQNDNSFFKDNFLDEGINPNYISTNKFNRHADLIFRFNYIFSMKNDAIKLTVGAMPIYHLKNDEYKGENGIRKDIPNSKGLTLNINSVFRYKLSPSNFIDITLGLPVIARESRPDGLSQLALNLQYGVKF